MITTETAESIGKKILFAKVFRLHKEDNSFIIGSCEDSLVEASKDGQLAIAVILEWK